MDDRGSAAEGLAASMSSLQTALLTNNRIVTASSIMTKAFYLQHYHRKKVSTRSGIPVQARARNDHSGQGRTICCAVPGNGGLLKKLSWKTHRTGATVLFSSFHLLGHFW
jgi:hypothetical protein